VSAMSVEFQGDASFSKTDLEAFYKALDLEDQKVTTIVGAFSPENPDGEATLDAQYLTAVGYGNDNWYWTSTGWMYTFASNLFAAKAVPHAVSMSWGWSEAGQCSTGIDGPQCHTLGVDNTQYINRVNVEFQKIGLRGVSLFASSGDSGANGRTDSSCTDDKLHPTFPAASPYVTAVGATQMKSVTSYITGPSLCKGGSFQCVGGGKEEAVSSETAGFTSGGGFSEVSARPAYQDAAVEAYLKGGVLPKSSTFNAKGRGYPDVAANGHNYLIYMESQDGWQATGGTSASSPTWAGVATRLIDFSMSKNSKPLGLLNPLLYHIAAENPAAFNDITDGDNFCTEDGCSPDCTGFNATKGWDAVSGLGTPNFPELTKSLSAILEKRAQILV